MQLHLVLTKNEFRTLKTLVCTENQTNKTEYPVSREFMKEKNEQKSTQTPESERAFSQIHVLFIILASISHLFVFNAAYSHAIVAALQPIYK